MNQGIRNVQEFHRKFGLPTGVGKCPLMHDREAQEFRLGFLQEELDELREALAQGNRTKAFDALLDLAYVTYGTALFMGIDPAMWDTGFEAVHGANMAKVRATSKAESKRDSTLDVVKPEGWQGPEEILTEILRWNP